MAYTVGEKSGNVVDISMGDRVALVRNTIPGLRQSHVTINFSRDRYKQRHDQEVDQNTEHVWKERTAKNSRLYNKSKFRLAGYFMEGDKLEMQIGLTSYKDLCGTNLADKSVAGYMKKGLESHGDKYAHIAQAVGVGVLLVTSDDHIVIQRRSLWTGEASGMWDRPGGHPEPSDVPQVDLRPTEDNTMIINKAILAEVWNSTINEAVDEVGIPRSSLPSSELLLMGLSCGTDRGDRPSLEFFARLPLTAAEVIQFYSSGDHAEADESTAIHLLPHHDVLALIAIIKGIYMKKEKNEKPEGETKKSEGTKDSKNLKENVVEGNKNTKCTEESHIGGGTKNANTKETVVTDDKETCSKETCSKECSAVSDIGKEKSSSKNTVCDNGKEKSFVKSVVSDKEKENSSNKVAATDSRNKIEDKEEHKAKSSSSCGGLDEGAVDVKEIASHSSPVLLAALLLAEDMLLEKKRK